MPLLFIFLGILLLIAAVGIGGLVYVGYRVKEKVTNVAQEVTNAQPHNAGAGADDSKPASPGQDDSNNLGGLLGNLGGILGGNSDEGGDPVEAISDKDPVIPCDAAAYPDQTGARVPLKPDTVLTTAWGIATGDVESEERVGSLDATSLTYSAKTEAYKDDDSGKDQKETVTSQTICNGDFLQANTFATVHWQHLPHIIHGLTRLRLSDKSFQEIKSTGKTYHVSWDVLNVDEIAKPIQYAGLLTRVEPQDVPYPMILNDQRVTLPAIHLTGIIDSIGKNPLPKKDRGFHVVADVYLIDDPLDPLVLMYRLKDPKFHNGKFRVEVTKIRYEVAHPVNLVEKQLAETKRAITWGIYFDFNKDTIKPESAPVLKQIVEAMTDNPDWKLKVEGNTDNIGGDTYNLDLSKRRAAAVKQALVTQYHIAPERLSTDGFGASHPIDTNDTLEGRARNRRVELSRE